MSALQRAMQSRNESHERGLTGRPRLVPEGVHRAQVDSAMMRVSRNGQRGMNVRFRVMDTAGEDIGSVFVWLNVLHTSKEAKRIAWEEAAEMVVALGLEDHELAQQDHYWKVLLDDAATEKFCVIDVWHERSADFAPQARIKQYKPDQPVEDSAPIGGDDLFPIDSGVQDSDIPV